MKDRHASERAKAQAFYAADAATYDATRWVRFGGRRTAERQARLVQGLLEKTAAGVRALEVGPGTGRISAEMIARPIGALVLADIALPMLRSAERRVRLSEKGDRSTELSLAQASLTELPFASDSFGIVVCVNVLTHVSALDRAMHEMARVTRPDGMVLFSVTNRRSIYWPAARRVGKTGHAIGQTVPSFWPIRRDVATAVAKAGMNIRTVCGHVHVPRLLDRPPFSAAVSALDPVFRRGLLRAAAPMHFYLIEKPGALTADGSSST